MIRYSRVLQHHTMMIKFFSMTEKLRLQIRHAETFRKADSEFGRGCTRVISLRLLMMTVPRVCGGYTPHTNVSVYKHTYTNTHTREKFRTYVRQHIRQRVEIIKGAWRARGCPDDGHVNQDGR